MRIIRFKYKDIVKWGFLSKENKIKELSKDPFSVIEEGKETFDLNRVKILPPVNPSKIVLVGLNYKKHAKELGMEIPQNPIIFMKPSTTLLAHRESIIYPLGVDRVDYEAELAFVIKKRAKNISSAEVEDYILGYTCLNDVTARNIQHEEGQWTRAKSYDTFCPLGPFIETEISPDRLKIESYLNGKLKQSSSTQDFIFPVSTIVAFISKVMTLYPGDVISTGTPQGVGPMDPGDEIEIVIEGIGSLKNKVVADKCVSL